MNDKEWADAAVRDILGEAGVPSARAKAVRRVLLGNLHLGRSGAYNAAAKFVNTAVCA